MGIPMILSFHEHFDKSYFIEKTTDISDTLGYSLYPYLFPFLLDMRQDTIHSLYMVCFNTEHAARQSFKSSVSSFTRFGPPVTVGTGLT